MTLSRKHPLSSNLSLPVAIGSTGYLPIAKPNRGNHRCRNAAINHKPQHSSLKGPLAADDKPFLVYSETDAALNPNLVNPNRNTPKLCNPTMYVWCRPYGLRVW